VSAAAAPSRVPIHKHDRLAGELVRAYRAGDPDALERLLKANDALVFTIVRRKLRGHGRGVDDASFEDLMQAGRMGILKAAEKYDPDRASWATFATWQIRACVGKEFESDTIVTVPKNWFGNTHKAELARAIGCKAGAVPVGRDGEEMTIETQVVDQVDHVAEVDREDEAETWGDRVRVALRRLPENQREVLLGRYGLEGERKSLGEIGDGLGVTKEAVRQMESRAERVLRNQLRLSYGEQLAESGFGPAEKSEDTNQERPMSTATSNGAAKSPTPMAGPATGMCPTCGWKLKGFGHSRGGAWCQCGVVPQAPKPKVLDPIPKLPPLNPRPAPPATVEFGDRLVSADVELEAMAGVLKAFRKLSPAGRRWVLENVERD
jgi:RNA polymerase sigma factor (sigma-70 family)